MTPIECRNLWKIYGSREHEALRAVQEEGIDKVEVLQRFNCVVGVVDASFSVNEGEIFCVMGLSGSGKSTLIRHINRLIDPTAGEIFVEGEDVGRMSIQELRRLRAEKIGMVFQNMALLPHRNVRQNVAFALELREVNHAERSEVAEKALETVQLSGWGHKYPDELSGACSSASGWRGPWPPTRISC